MEVKDYVENLGEDGRIILKYISKEYSRKIWTGAIC